VPAVWRGPPILPFATRSVNCEALSARCYHAPMSQIWIERWRAGRTGWHEPGGNAGLRAHWQRLNAGTRVLVPLCGKSPDLLWLAEQGHEVVGVELSGIAVQAFFEENELAHSVDESGALPAWRAEEMPITIHQGDYFAVELSGFDALYDRGALVAMSAGTRPAYVEKTQRSLDAGAGCLIVTLEYDQARVDGPPFAIMPEEIRRYWPDLERAEARDDLDTSPPKFREAGLGELYEVVWLRPWSARADARQRRDGLPGD